MDFIGRRNFLKATASTLVLSSMPMYSSAKAKGNDTLKISIVGAGRSGFKAIKTLFAINENTKIISIADAFEDCAFALRDKALALSKKYKNSKDIF